METRGQVAMAEKRKRSVWVVEQWFKGEWIPFLEASQNADEFWADVERDKWAETYPAIIFRIVRYDASR